MWGVVFTACIVFLSNTTQTCSGNTRKSMPKEDKGSRWLANTSQAQYLVQAWCHWKMGPPIPHKSILKKCKQDSNGTQGSSRSLLRYLFETTKQGKNGWSRIRPRARYVSMQHMHSRLSLGLPYAIWLLPQPWCPPKYKPIKRTALPSLPGHLWRLRSN